jgi:hypothetical protein
LRAEVEVAEVDAVPSVEAEDDEAVDDDDEPPLFWGGGIPSRAVG